MSICKFCSASFDDQKQLEDHEELHRSIDVLNGVEASRDNYQCDQCSACFDDRRNLKAHTEAHSYIDTTCYDVNSPPPKRKKIQESPTSEITYPISPQPSTSRGTVGENIIHHHNADSTDSSDDDILQSGGAAIKNPDPLAYEIEKVGHRTFKNLAEDHHFKVKFDTDHIAQDTPLSDLYGALEQMLDDVLAEIAPRFKETDLVRVIIHHDSLTNPIYVQLTPLGEMTGDKILSYLTNVLSSNQSLTLNASFRIDVGVIRLSAGGIGLQINNISGEDSSLLNKKSIIQILSNDNTCLPRAVVTTFLSANQVSTREWNDRTKQLPAKTIEEHVLDLKMCPYWYFKEIRRPSLNGKHQTTLCSALCRRVNLPLHRPHTIKDIEVFEKFFDVDILVITSQTGNRFCKVPSEESTKQRCYLYLVNGDNGWHYHGISKINAFFGKSKFCELCLKPYRDKHDCQVSCVVCGSNECRFVADEWQSCTKCQNQLRSNACFERHLKPKNSRVIDSESRCKLYWKCTQCKKIVDTRKRNPVDHFCGEWLCKCCKNYVDTDHLCFIRALEQKDPCQKFIFFDFECTQDGLMQCSEGYNPKVKTGCGACDESPIPCKDCSTCRNCENNTCGKKLHEPNLVVSQTVCNSCIDEDITPESKCSDCGSRCKKCNAYDSRNKCYKNAPCISCGYREMLFKGEKTMLQFGEWLFSPMHKNFVAMAHNLKGYDGYFILEYLIKQSIRPKVIYAGSKVMSITVQNDLNIKFLDSVNFLPMKLSALSSAFSLNGTKGHFPFLFNKKENMSYRGPYPAPHFYGYDAMGTSERVDFLDWYNTETLSGREFDFEAELTEYCRADVQVLREACMKFRNLLLRITDKDDVDSDEDPHGVDPFNDITIAGVCMTVYKTKFLRETWDVRLKRDGMLTEWLPAMKLDGNITTNLEGTWYSEEDLQRSKWNVEDTRFVSSPLAQIPANGYVSRDQFSMVSIHWLEWMMEKGRRDGVPVQIQHALNGGEVRVPGTKYKFDGFDAKNRTGYSFEGCFYHGCRSCFPNRRYQLRSPRTNQSMEELYTLTLKRNQYLQSEGFKIVSVWEHEFRDLLQANPEAKAYVEGLDLQERLDPRDSFFGGRTNAVKLHHRVTEDEQIMYYDVTSLYPWVNRYCKYPVKQPVIITSDFQDLSHYFGIAKVKILPPRGLYHPILPMRCNGKLTFALCRTCASNQSQQPCRCSDDKRFIIGTWCTPEIQAAIDYGYKIIKIYEVYHWEETEQFNPEKGEGGIFGDYITLFLKIKQEASGRPDWVKTEEDLDKYIDDYFGREQILLDREKILKNKALRSLAKLFLNSLWGKFGQHLNTTQTGFFHETEADKFFQCIANPDREIKDFSIITDEIIQVSWENKRGIVKEDYKTNVFIATFTTCWARLKLYGYLDKLGRRVLYYDTDSVIFVSKSSDENPRLGDYLGDLTSEVEPGDHIVEFVSGGPKAYAYVTFRGNQVCKIRGFSLNYANSKRLNFQSLLELVTSPENPNCQETKKPKSIVLNNPQKITRSKYLRKIYNRSEDRVYKIVYTKRVIQKGTLDTLPYGY